MPTFEYLALDASGSAARGNIVAESASAARRQLRNRQLHATKLQPVSEAAQAGGWEWGRLLRGRRRREVLQFTRQLGTMVQADVKLTEGLSVLSNQTVDAKLGQVVQNIRDQVIAGESLADGLKQYPGWFDPVYIAMIRVGEMTGNIGRSLKLLGDYMGKRQRLEGKVKSALTYPAILVVICLLVTIILMTFVVPKLTEIITESGRSLPRITAALMWLSDCLIEYWWGLLLAVGAVWYVLKRSVGTQKGRAAFDLLVLRVPVVGELIRQSVVARFATTLAALIRSGLPMADSLDVVAETTGNAVLAQAIRTARERIIAGADIATPLQRSKVVDPTVAHMIAVGERTGELESMLLTIADSLEESSDLTIQRISSVIEPIIIVIMAVVVGFIVIATLMPILQVADVSGL